MAFMARVKELGRAIAGVNDSEELDITDKNDEIDENKVKEIIMVHPELLKALASLGKNEKDVETGIADTNSATPKKNKSGEFKRSLDAMTEVLRKNKEQSNREPAEATKDEQQREIVD